MTEHIFDDDAFDHWILMERANRPTKADMIQEPRSDGRGWGGRWVAQSTRECGSVGGWREHVKHNEEPCEPCKIARRAYQRAGYIAHPRALRPCGTLAAYTRHKKAGETPCDACREARADYEYKRRGTKRPEWRTQLKPCGTMAAYKRHLRHGETPDAVCRAANAAIERERRKVRV